MAVTTLVATSITDSVLDLLFATLAWPPTDPIPVGMWPTPIVATGASDSPCRDRCAKIRCRRWRWSRRHGSRRRWSRHVPRRAPRGDARLLALPVGVEHDGLVARRVGDPHRLPVGRHGDAVGVDQPSMPRAHAATGRIDDYAGQPVVGRDVERGAVGRDRDDLRRDAGVERRGALLRVVGA